MLAEREDDEPASPLVGIGNIELAARRRRGAAGSAAPRRPRHRRSAVSASVTATTSQTPPMSASAMSSAVSCLASRKQRISPASDSAAVAIGGERGEKRSRLVFGRARRDAARDAPGRRRIKAPQIGRMIGDAERGDRASGPISPHRAQFAARPCRRRRRIRRAAARAAVASERRGARRIRCASAVTEPRSNAELGLAPKARAKATAACGTVMGNETTTRRPGALSSMRKAPWCRRATAAASDSPRPEPGREREFSSRTKRSMTRARSSLGDARPAIGRLRFRRPPEYAARGDAHAILPARAHRGRCHISAHCRRDWRPPGRSVRGCHRP